MREKLEDRHNLFVFFDRGSVFICPNFLLEIIIGGPCEHFALVGVLSVFEKFDSSTFSTDDFPKIKRHESPGKVEDRAGYEVQSRLQRQAHEIKKSKPVNVTSCAGLRTERKTCPSSEYLLDVPRSRAKV